MSYIGTQPVPQSLQSRQQFTGDGSTTTFATIGGVELYEDVFLNGVRLSRVDNEYSFDGTTLTITPAPANGDTVSIILRNDHSELIALPITDSQGNNVLSESSGVVTLSADNIIIDNAGKISSVGQIELQVDTDNNQSGTYIGFSRNNTTSERLALFQENGDISFYEETGTTAKFYWDASAESLAIGTSSPNPYRTLTVDGGAIIYDELFVSLPSANTSRFAFVGTPANVTSSVNMFKVGAASNDNIINNVQSGISLGEGYTGMYAYDNGGSADTGMAFFAGSNITVNEVFSIRYSDFIINEQSADIDFRVESDTNTHALFVDAGRGEVCINGSADRGTYNLQVNGTGVWGQGAYANGSDERMKQNIADLNDGLEIVNQLRPVTYQFREEFSKDQNTQPGFIAQELQQALDGKDYKDGVVSAGPQYLNVAYQNLIPILTKAVQEQQAIIDALEVRIAALENT